MAASIAWALVLAVLRGGNPWGQVLLLLLVSATVVAARAAASSGRPVAPLAVAAAGAALLLASVGAHTRGAGLPFGLPIGAPKASFPPLIYPNANGAFFVQATAAALILAAAPVGGGIRRLGVAGSVIFGLAAVLSGSLAASVTLVVVAAALLASGRPVATRLTVVGCSLLFVAVLMTTVGIASSEPGRLQRRERIVAQRLGGIRIDLWREGYAVMAEHPVAGVGPGRFGAAAPSLRRDRDQLWAHNEFLQQGAETGVPGFVFVFLLVGWGFARLWLAPPDRITGVAAGALAALAVHASLDYVVHFPIIPLAAAAVIGTAQGARERRELRPGRLVRKAVKAVALPAGLVAPRRPGDVVILLYHRVGAGNREIDLPVEPFEEQMAELAARHRVLRLDDLLNGERSGGVLVTFDDGQRDFHERALPVLVRHGIPSALYLATSWVGNRRVKDALSWSQVDEAVGTGLVEIGSHTHRHLDLSTVGEREAEREMRRSRDVVEERLGRPCRHFAYPWGVSSDGADRAARRLFETAVLAWGTNRDGFDRHRLGRLPVLRSDGPLFFRAKVRGLLDGEAWVYRVAGRGPWRRP